MEKLVQKLKKDLTNSTDVTSVEITEDKLKHWSNLTRVQKTFVNKISGKQYKKFVWVRKEEPKKARQRAAQEDPAANRRQGAPEQQHRQGAAQPERQPQGGQNKQPQQGGGIGQVRERRIRRQPGWFSGSDIRVRMAGDKDYAFENMLFLHEFQRDDEKMVKMTKYKNMVGFNKQDAAFFGNLIQMMKDAGGLRRLMNVVGPKAQQDMEFAVQGRMAKYSNQLADIFNDDNRWRNFKSMTDAFKNAKGVRTDQLTGFTAAVQPMNKQVEEAFAQSGAKMWNSENAREAIGKRGPKWKEDGLVKRFDNAKYAAEVYYQMKEIGNNPNPRVQALYQKYMQARFPTGDGIDQMMAKGFGALNMKQKNKLKEHMKNMATYVVDVFNEYKAQGVGIPAGKKFVGKGLKQIQDENMINGPLREQPAAPAPGQLKPRPQAPAQKPAEQQPVKAPEQPAAPAKRPGEGKNIFRDIEEAFSNGLTKTIDYGKDVKVAARKGINATYALHLGKENEAFYKPMEGNHDRGEYIREVMAFESAKMLGADTLVTPTKFYTPEIKGMNMYKDTKGSVQMSTRVFAEKLGMTDVKAAAEVEARNMRKDIIDKCDNFQDLVVFDFLLANTDRHQNNLHMAKTANGGYHAIAIDHGFTFGGKQNADWAIREHAREAIKTSRKDAAISFSDGIKNFDENKYRELAKKNGMEDHHADNFVSRVKQMRKYGEQNGIKKWKLSDFANFVTDVYRIKM